MQKISIPESLTLNEKRDYALDKIDHLTLKIKLLKNDIRWGDEKNRGRRNTDYSVWRKNAKNDIASIKLQREQYKNALIMIKRTIKRVHSTPLNEAQCFMAVAQEVLNEDVFDKIRAIATGKRSDDYE